MLSAYQRERQGAELEIEPGKGFATWKLLFDPTHPAPLPVRDVYLVDIYVAPDHRRTGLASQLTDRVAAKGKAE